MLDTIDIVEEGWENAISNLNALPLNVGVQVMGHGLFEAANVVASEAYERAPEDTGRLKRSIKARIISSVLEVAGGTKKVRNSAAQVRAGGRRAPHAVIVEFGRIKYNRTDRQPFLEPAFLATRSEQFERAAKVFREKFAQLNPNKRGGA